MKYVPNAVTKKVAGAALRTQFHSPKLLFAAGVAGMGATVFLACKATLKLDEVLTDAEKTTQDIESSTHLSAKDLKHDLMYHRLATAGRVAALYAPAAAVGVLSIASLTQSQRILTRRNAALTAAYTTLAKAFEDYRQRVRDTFGEKGDEVDRKFMHGVRTVEEIDENGKTKTVQVVGDGAPSGYARFFDDLNPNWQRNHDLNLWWLRQKQNWLNDRLKANGHVFLNEVYDELGLDKTKAGQIVGWWWGRDSDGDGEIDFGIWDATNDRAIDFVNGRQKGILLDFNCDGPIYEKLSAPLDARKIR